MRIPLICALVLLVAPFSAHTGDAQPPPAVGAAVAPAAPAAEPEWQKLAARLVPLTDPRQMLSPGLFDSDLQHVITFPKDGSAVNLDLPRNGKDKNGKAVLPLLARLQQGVVWVDMNGDGKPSPEETRRLSPEGQTEVFNCDLYYDDGSSAPYSFKLKGLAGSATAPGEKFVLLRSCMRSIEHQGHKIVLLDDNGNGKYNDSERDCIQIDDGPVCFIGRYLAIGDKFYEVLPHAAGLVLEIRPAGKIDMGYVDMFVKYKPSQKSETLKIHTLIISGPQGSFAFDEKRRILKVPAGSYDLVFGLFERAKEVVYLKKGDKTSFTVPLNLTATPAWGGLVTSKFELSTDGQEITVGAPQFTGEGSERYVPENFRTVRVQASMAQVYTDRMKIERVNPAGTERFKVLPDGDLAPVVLDPLRMANDEYEVAVEYASGIMGKVTGKQKIQFVPKKKEKK